MSSPKNATLPKRSISPIFWLLFGAGGMMAALIGPGLIIITGIMIPHGWGVPESFDSYASALAFARNPLGKLVLLAVIALLFWHAAERAFLTLHDMRVGPVLLLRWATYGLAAVLTLVVTAVLLAIGF
ncbi:fumarate reductase subunit FrdD [Bradyrhizobium sp. HKCCYLS1011]|uniref:fumarate reductase subunit FrdD n=1 Tax=Bradyrhizobium sp. HKCCYLS1011 TaxID=3420733 RepID=UPI003EB7EA5E